MDIEKINYWLLARFGRTATAILYTLTVPLGFVLFFGLLWLASEFRVIGWLMGGGMVLFLLLCIFCVIIDNLPAHEKKKDE